MISYLGHSDFDYWDFGPLYHRDDVQNLPAGHPAPIIAQWGCWNSYFVALTIDTMAHALLLTENKGAASLIGSSTLTNLEAHEALGRQFFEIVAQGPIALGDALLRAQRAVANNYTGLRDDVLAMNLFGDPAVPLGQ